MSLLATRVITLVLMLLGTLLCGMLPIFIRRCTRPSDCERNSKCSCVKRRWKSIIAFLIYFGGGVLLATCFLHLMPEAREGFQHQGKNKTIFQDKENMSFTDAEADDSGHEEDTFHEFPLPEFIVCCGFFTVYLLEEMLHAFLGSPRVPEEEENNSSHDANNVSFASSPVEEEEDWEGIYRADPPNYGAIPKKLKEKAKSHSKKVKKDSFTLSGLLTVAALSFHSVFDGFALGLQATETDTWTLFFALGVHKFVIAFVIGLEEIMLNGREILVVVYMAIFSVVSPLGGMAAILTEMNVGDSSGVVVGVLQAIATGTLLYVTFFEILLRGKSNKEFPGVLQMLAAFLGFGIMASLHFVLNIIK